MQNMVTRDFKILTAINATVTIGKAEKFSLKRK